MKHSDNVAEVITDLPLDNGGKGRGFSPTDFFASSLGACAMTIMGKYAEADGKSIVGTTVEISKAMGVNPRRIAEIGVKFTFPETVPPEERPNYLAYLKTCPVYNSLNNDIKVTVTSN
ncbi:MAG: OsmC family protein [Planctomycetaceae bacterium]|nr:OsmC family protein [Planctomycetaceae bacterium]